jgi:hypothetical protein
MAIITKLEAAHRQLVTAIRMYFDDDDIAAIHTLACAAREIYEKHCQAAGLDRMFQYIENSNPDKSRKELWEILNGPRNFLKHPAPDLDLSAAIELDDSANSHVIFVACHDCAILCKEAAPPTVHAYSLWFLGAIFPLPKVDEPDGADALKISKAIRAAYPGIREAPLGQQKQIGRQMLVDASRLAAQLGTASVL